jgi:hypothetical protein
MFSFPNTQVDGVVAAAGDAGLAMLGKRRGRASKHTAGIFRSANGLVGGVVRPRIPDAKIEEVSWLPETLGLVGPSTESKRPDDGVEAVGGARRKFSVGTLVARAELASAFNPPEAPTDAAAGVEPNSLPPDW